MQTGLIFYICLLILIAFNVALGKPVSEQVDSSALAATDVRVPKMYVAEGASPIYHAGIASVNGRFGKSIRAFTVNEFEKYIGGLA